MSTPKTRKVTVKLGPNSPEDPTRILEAIQAAFEPTDVEVQVGATRDADATRTEPNPTRANEQVEEEMRRRMGDRLNSKAAKVRAENERQGKPANARRPAPPDEVVAKRRTLRDKVRLVRKAGWRVTVKVVWEVAKEYALDAVI